MDTCAEIGEHAHDGGRVDLFAWGSFGSSGGPWRWAAPGALCLLAAVAGLVVVVPLDMRATSAFLALWALIAALSVWRRGPQPAALALAWPLLGLALISVPMKEADDALRALFDHAQERTAQGIAPGEARSLRLLHGAAAAGLWALGLPEAASAAWQRHEPGAAVRTIADDVAMYDPEVRREVRLIATQARGGETTFPPRPITWHSWTDERRSLRAAMALDCPGRLEAQPTPRGLRLALRCPPAERTYAGTWGRVGGQDLKWDPAVLTLLELRGDLQRYEAVWTWEVSYDDPRLQDTSTVERGPGEVLLRALHGWLMQG
jgi:hypothetical protein